MKTIRLLYHFFGSVYFAIILIAFSALFVITGTILESQSDSHLYAAQWTYQHPVFKALLFFFFVNILFSAVRRWPFKWGHFPFLLTHLGLLMIIAGTYIKTEIGLQGNLTIWEGSGNDLVLIPNTESIWVEKNGDDKIVASLPFKKDQLRSSLRDPKLNNFSIKLLAGFPHVREDLEAWIRNSTLYLFGYPPLKASFEDVHSFNYNGMDGELMYISGGEFYEIVKTLYTKNLKIKLNSENEINFDQILNQGIAMLDGSHINAELKFTEHPFRILFSHEIEGLKSKGEIHLSGEMALICQRTHSEKIKSSIPPIDLVRDKPLIAFIEDNDKKVHLLALDQVGRLLLKPLEKSSMTHIQAYHYGFGGYSTQLQLPIFANPPNRVAKECYWLNQIETQISAAMNQASILSPPIRYLIQTPDQPSKETIKCLVEFLHAWNQSPTLLMSTADSFSPALIRLFQAIDLSDIPKEDQKACCWIERLFQQLDLDKRSTQSTIDYLVQHKWPLVDSIKEIQTDHPEQIPLVLAQQIYGISPQLPDTTQPDGSLDQKIRFFCAYFLAYGIDSELVNPLRSNFVEEDFSQINPSDAQPLILETPLSTRLSEEPPPKKIEDWCGCVVLEAREGLQKQTLALAYQRNGEGFKWPIFGGSYVLRYQPQFIRIPYRLRLRQARDIRYLDSDQPFSYECDIILTDIEGRQAEATLSMNRVYETWEGHRFYLAGIAGSTEDQFGIKRAQIVVNYDPAKYWLTYPGGMLVFLGTLLLFFKKRR